MSECLNCFSQYNETESTAPTEKELYCSIECQKKDEEKLSAGNKIIANALREDPNAFLHTGIFSGDNPLIPIRNTQEDQINDVLAQLGYDPKKH